MGADLNASANSHHNSAPRSLKSSQMNNQPLVSSTQNVTKIPKLLPHERVFPIQIGSELFKLSGASISSDAPSYFSQYFQAQVKQAEENGEDLSTAVRTLYIDRDPTTFKDISLHLQGYHVQPRDARHFVRLFADAQFYSLPKLVSQLYEESIFTCVGGREFQISRDLFSGPGNSPNFFTLGFAVFFSSPEDLFPGLDREGLLRPPSIEPPSIPNRSPDIFAELLHLLRGYPVHIRSEHHRAELLRDCRYFNFKGLEQRLIPHAISFNQARGREEIVLRLRDILKSGITIGAEPTSLDPLAGWVTYARPFVDDHPYELVLEIGEESTRLRFGPGGTAPRAEFFRDARTRVAKLFEVIATKLNLPPTTQPLGLLMAKGGASSQPPTPGNTPLSEDLVRVIFDPEASITLDGRTWNPSEDDFFGGQSFPPVGTAGGGGGGGNISAPSSAGGAAGHDSPVSVSTPLPPPPQSTASRKRRRIDAHGFALSVGVPPNPAGPGPEEWIVRNGQWRLRIQGAKNGKAAVECVLVAVKLDAMSSEQARNAQRGFLGGG
ncbi:hypothetical protein QBC47DRAFT_383848 [Echria macrotheca]|uniref:Potassium channel tetramerisation-type BTB domain-containing protein n=1 Tax=Echria macrotheca TaxID=438768 RepID=A0AAJ0FAM6_9PEZI|nr:hypothetical protein QBC47DRAFT_383848 [Echria macrotheca]